MTDKIYIQIKLNKLSDDKIIRLYLKQESKNESILCK